MKDTLSLAKGHNTVTPMRLETRTPRSRVKHSTTEPLRSLISLMQQWVKVFRSIPEFWNLRLTFNRESDSLILLNKAGYDTVQSLI